MTATRTYSHSFGVIALIISMSSLCIGTSFAKSLFSELGAQGTTSYRLLFSALLLCLIWRPWRFSLDRHQIIPVIKFGICLGLINFLFYMAIRTIPLGLAIAIEFLGPLGLALFSSRRKLDFLWIALVILGLGLLLPLNDKIQSLDPLGVIYALGAAFFWALYIITGQAVRHVHPGVATTLGVSIAALFTLPFALVHLGGALWRPDLFWFGLLVGVLSSALPYSFEMISLRTLQRQTMGVLLSLEPAIGAIAGAIILHEFLTLQQVIAISCVVAASIGCAITARKTLINGA